MYTESFTYAVCAGAAACKKHLIGHLFDSNQSCVDKMFIHIYSTQTNDTEGFRYEGSTAYSV